MEEPVVKGDGKIIFSFKDNQCIVETEYAPVPSPTPSPAVLSREPQLPFHQTIMAGNPQGQSWMTTLIVFQSISMIVGIIFLVAIGVYLAYRSHDPQTQLTQTQMQVLLNRSRDSQEQLTKTQMQIQNQEGTIDQLQVELKRLTEELKRFELKEKNREFEKKELETTPQIETNLNK